MLTNISTDRSFEMSTDTSVEGFVNYTWSKNCSNSQVWFCVTLKIISPVFFVFSCMVEHGEICKQLYLVKIKPLKLWSDCRPSFCWHSNLPLTRHFHGNLIGINCTALDQSQKLLSNFVECIISRKRVNYKCETWKIILTQYKFVTWHNHEKI